jgi:hypothetical protein
LVQCIELLPTGRQQAKTSPETCRADIERSINGNCCIFLVTYAVVLMTHGHTNIKETTLMKRLHTNTLEHT